MQRLNRTRDDRGAVAVWVAILMVPLMIVAALAIDIGSVNADRQRLQTGADAAALAIAQQCAGGHCGDAQSTAEELANANRPVTGDVEAAVLELDTAAGWVEVETSSTRDLWFGAVAGRNSISPAAVGAASWGAPSGGRSVMPFTFFSCELEHAGVLQLDGSHGIVGLKPTAVGRTFTLYQTQFTATACTGNSGNAVPGGFGWLQSDAECASLTAIGMPAYSAPGGSERSKCESWLYAQALRREVLLLPIFDRATGSGSGAVYSIAGYLAVTIERYRFQGQTCFPQKTNGGCEDPGVGNGSSWLKLKVHSLVDLDSDFETSPTAPSLGAQIVNLELPTGSGS